LGITSEQANEAVGSVPSFGAQPWVLAENVPWLLPLTKSQLAQNRT